MRLIPTEKVGKRSPCIAQTRKKSNVFEKVHRKSIVGRFYTIRYLIVKIFKQKHNFYTKN